MASPVRFASLLAVVVAPWLVACSAETASEGGGSGSGSSTQQALTCAPAGTWVLHYTLDAAASDALCEPLRDEVSQENGAASFSTPTCDDGCTCQDGFGAYPSCGGVRSKSCKDENGTWSWRLELAREATDRYTGRADGKRTSNGYSLSCVYAVRYERR